MTLARLRLATIMVACVACIGCGDVSLRAGDEVDVTGQVSGRDGKPISDVSIHFQPTGGNALPAQFDLNADGTFSGKMLAGQYTYYLTTSVTKPTKKGAVVLESLPAEYRQGSMERQITVRAGRLDIKFQ
jgi:hypothetical protein